MAKSDHMITGNHIESNKSLDNTANERARATKDTNTRAQQLSEIAKSEKVSCRKSYYTLN